MCHCITPTGRVSSKRRQKGAPSKNTRKGEVVHEHYRFKAQHGNSSSKDGHHGEERGKCQLIVMFIIIAVAAGIF